MLSILCLILSVWIIAAGRTNERLQQQLQNQQAEIDRGNAGRQIGSSILRDMIAASATNREMRAVLEKNGFVRPQTQGSPVIKIEKAVPEENSMAKNVSTSGKKTTGKAVKNGSGK